MATTQGRVLQLIWADRFVCAQVGSSPSNASLFFVEMRPGDTEHRLGTKQALVKLLGSALHSRRSVLVGHATNNSEIESVEIEPADISPVCPAIHNDFYSITGSNFPNDVEAVFRSGPLTVTVVPDVRRPHWVVIGQLPPVVPVGRGTVQLRNAAGWASSQVPIDVAAGPPMQARTLYPGRTSRGAYTIVFAASPGRLTEAGMVVSDGILSDRPSFHRLVTHCLNNLLTLDESLLRTGNMDRLMRFTTIFDRTRSAGANTALVHEITPDLLEPQRTLLNGFVNPYGDRADVVYCISADTIHTRASAWFGDDEVSLTAPSYTYDGTTRRNGFYPRVPGSVAQSTSMNTTGLTALHEFGHAASDFANGMVTDLYVDDIRSGFVVNQKARALSTDPVPANFATVDTTTYTADSARDSIGYPTDWVSYHPSLQVANRPNVMDNYWTAGANVLQCRLDGLTFDWFVRRLRTKVDRPE
jgi:hypothetical protein